MLVFGDGIGYYLLGLVWSVMIQGSEEDKLGFGNIILRYFYFPGLAPTL
jgi:hypothetical protein